MPYEIITTDTFSKEFKKHKKDGEFLKALDNKIQRLRDSPENFGGYLSGKLHGFKSTRIIKRFRLIFKIDSAQNKVYLMSIDHRKFAYNDVNFD